MRVEIQLHSYLALTLYGVECLDSHTGRLFLQQKGPCYALNKEPPRSRKLSGESGEEKTLFHISGIEILFCVVGSWSSKYTALSQLFTKTAVI